MPSTRYDILKTDLRESPRRWLVTGGAGFIGSHLIETLLGLDQTVVCFDNFATGYEENLEAVRNLVTPEQANRLKVIRGDLADYGACLEACEGIDHALHQGALGSVPRSIEDPVGSHEANATGTLNLFTAAREKGIRRVVYASSSSVYGDEPNLPKVEEKTGKLLSPYAATKAIAEVYAESFSQCYDMEFCGLRYFNVFGPRQDPDGPYAAVIPIWIASMIRGEPVYINGDGETSRDFTYVANVVQANLLAATVPELPEPARVFNVAIGGRTTLNELFESLREALKPLRPELEIADPVYRDFRPGDIRHSHADYSRARGELGFAPTHDLSEGLALAMPYYLSQVD
ncbi:MAG: SDR family oxidoreductase [Verrucomicrobiae bacterium]|nr:SDR family oxidoreductase [Verrucomicrobiae bacterium]